MGPEHKGLLYEWIRISGSDLYEKPSPFPRTLGVDMNENGTTRHPDKLPYHLDMDLYAEFLSMQPPVLASMEEYILRAGQEAIALTELRRTFHTLKGEAGFFRLEAVENLCHVAEDTLDTDTFSEDMTSVFLDIQSWLKKAFDWYSGKKVPVPEDPAPLHARLGLEKPISEIRENNAASGVTGVHRQVRENVLVEAERLDRLMDTIGELVIVETMVRQAPELASISGGSLNNHLAQLTKLTRELQNLGLNLRMVPIRPLFMKMQRMVQELGKSLGKPVLFQSTGDETELDRSLVEHLRDPLLHLVRNAMGHGIEEPEIRKAKNKPEQGLLRIEARHGGGDIHIIIEDDGQGLNADAIAKKAREKGLLAADVPLTPEMLEKIIFHPGFTTAASLTEISGRGVGLDVVREQILSLSGSIHVDSTRDAGTRFHLRIPMTVAIIDGIVCRCGRRRYVIPTLSVLGSLEVRPEDICSLPTGMTMAPFQDRLIPAFPLEILLQRPEGRGQSASLMMVLESENQRSGIFVDEILGKQQIVVKPLGESFKEIQGIAGAAIMPDGEVGLILDPQGLIRASLSQVKGQAF
ncbi:two-component system chemotaxis sensor kinase CheA [Desulfobotulus alkaliphilus]|uniref:Chemotaxis protein CheA n=1 Tax=Desulfobotulus alkaliphilus TaxID=622671 RepID=A0A562S0A1_9BACT|nr:chemotaxis protein CheA [Desulfobotulus alkaliphilus]TWI74304.1 two-component system chemotaxis sensor kinase CheA [Desulfobotulus alkaliphilus]